MKMKNINILGIFDHNINHTDKIVYENIGNLTLITSSAWRNSNNASVGGIGIMVDRSSENVITEIKKWNERILIVNFNGNPMTTLIIHYSPCEGRNDAAEHYYQLTQATATIPKHNILLTVGDFNVHIGSHDTDNKFTFHQSTNTNGKLAIDYAEEADMITTNTHFQKRKGKLWTFLSDTGSIKTQVDYIMLYKLYKLYKFFTLFIHFFRIII